ncbi:hypothetical protein [Maridesulfovibrio salexigens]|uniref:Uncharacterized protein n=1 Tax=Maridesulfovibrio salexigens (strain ATCC 14822 / DSM 2638 / NCIMB 8403 / VKM B-1763) TaxID=526222 RepID=C6BZQ9_MARSD|nr:hypothetical protein [Maridesulfovibrio salexigens]ACS78966.1 conserved hypothetical protein [Maridesulfovibrio salexigens DSM 2638]
MKIFVRERVKATDGDKRPRYRVVGVQGEGLTLKVKRIRKCELREIAKHTGAEIVYLERDGKGKEGKRD